MAGTMENANGSLLDEQVFDVGNLKAIPHFGIQLFRSILYPAFLRHQGSLSWIKILCWKMRRWSSLLTLFHSKHSLIQNLFPPN